MRYNISPSSCVRAWVRPLSRICAYLSRRPIGNTVSSLDSFPAVRSNIAVYRFMTGLTYLSKFPNSLLGESTGKCELSINQLDWS